MMVRVATAPSSSTWISEREETLPLWGVERNVCVMVREGAAERLSGRSAGQGEGARERGSRVGEAAEERGGDGAAAEGAG